MKKQIPIILLMLFAGSIAFVSCSKDTTEIYTPSEITIQTAEQKLTAQGWIAFTAGNYQQAVDSFEMAKITNSLFMDAYNGLGWAYARLDSLQKAYNCYTICMISKEDVQIYKDACAGRSFVNLAMNDYVRAIEDVNNTILFEDESGYYYGYYDYTFRHEPNINQADLLLVKAESYFMLGNYESCFNALVVIDDTLEPTSNPEELAMIIEQLKASI